MFSNVKRIHNEINALYSQNNKNSLIFIDGEKGLGKSTAIQQFLNDKEHYLQFFEATPNEFFLQPVVNGITSYSIKHNTTQQLNIRRTAVAWIISRQFLNI